MKLPKAVIGAIEKELDETGAVTLSFSGDSFLIQTIGKYTKVGWASSEQMYEDFKSNEKAREIARKLNEN